MSLFDETTVEENTRSVESIAGVTGSSVTRVDAVLEVSRQRDSFLLLGSVSSSRFFPSFRGSARWAFSFHGHLRLESSTETRCEKFERFSLPSLVNDVFSATWKSARAQRKEGERRFTEFAACFEPRAGNFVGGNRVSVRRVERFLVVVVSSFSSFRSKGNRISRCFAE